MIEFSKNARIHFKHWMKNEVFHLEFSRKHAVKSGVKYRLLYVFWDNHFSSSECLTLIALFGSRGGGEFFFCFLPNLMAIISRSRPSEEL